MEIFQLIPTFFWFQRVYFGGLGFEGSDSGPK